MAIKFRCPDCSHGIKAPDAAAGKGVRCPNCSKKVRVPSGSSGTKKRSSSARRKKVKTASDEDSNAFLENIDLGNAELSGVELCQKCAAELPPDETTCPSCGFDPEQLTTSGRKRQKMAAKGIDPQGYYENVLRDPFGFTFGHFGQVMKTGGILTFYFLLAAFCAYWLMWVATVPPYAFWLLLTTVSVLIPLGWLLVQHLEIIRLALEKKDRIKKIRFDFALCGMSGMKFLAWVLVFGLPFWIVFGGLGILLDSSGMALGLPIGAGLSLFCILIFTPQAMSHLAMPVEGPGWVFPKIAKTLDITFVPGFVWAILFLVVNLPIIGGVAALNATGGDKLARFMEIHQDNALIHRAEVELDLAESSGQEDVINEAKEKWTDIAARERQENNLSSLFLPAGIGIVCCFYLGFSSVLVARANGLFTTYLRRALNLLSAKKEKSYVRKGGEEKIRTRKTTLPAPAGRRFGAYVIDTIIIWIIIGAIWGLFVYVSYSLELTLESMAMKIAWIVVFNVLPTIVIAIYFITNESGNEQTTPGKKLLGLFVVGDDRCTPMSTGQAVLRFLAFYFLTGLTFFIAPLIACFRKDRQTLYDMVTGTQVRMDKPEPKEKSEEK